MFIRNAWYVAAWSSEVSQAPITRKILGKLVVLFRTQSGQVAALEDRCCHRGMPLSRGEVEGDIIRCPYHGMEFGPSGQCTLIPGQDLVPQHARVRSFPTVVLDEIVWIWPGDADKADPKKIIAYPYHRPNSGWAWKATVWHVKCNWELINDNLLDLTHLALVHKSMIGGNNTVHFDTQTQVTRMEGGLRTARFMPNSDPPPAYLKAVAFKGKVDRWQEMEGWPGLMLAYTGGVDAGNGALEGRREGGYQIRVFNGITPETETTTHYFWSKAHNFSIDDPSVTQKQFAQTELIFGEDRDVLELQQARILESPQRGFVDLRADHAGLLMRRIIRQAIDGERVSAKAS